MEIRLYKNKAKRPTEKYSLRYGKTIIAILPDYLDIKFIKGMVKALNSQPIGKPDVLN